MPPRSRARTRAAPPRDLPRGRALRPIHDLEENLVLPDHAQLEAGPFLDRLKSLFQVANLGIERGVARLQRLVLRSLRAELPVVFPHPRPAALPEPEWILDREQQRGEGEGQRAHLAKLVEGVPPRITHRVAEVFLDPQQLVVL